MYYDSQQSDALPETPARPHLFVQPVFHQMPVDLRPTTEKETGDIVVGMTM